VNPLDPLDQPFLPVLGLFWVSTVILWSGDKKPTRPVVIIDVPPTCLAESH
jgi:hypothetical protein